MCDVNIKMNKQTLLSIAKKGKWHRIKFEAGQVTLYTV